MSTADNTAVAATASSKSAAGGKEENQGSAGNRKTASSRPPEQSLKCPRCDSPNTKFCYYNNYSLTQPRHFCKTCRRYWTKGGALRNVPVGGGCRKNKKVKSSSRLIAGAGGAADSKDSSSSSSDHHFGPVGLNLKFFHGISPAMDFQLGGLNSFPSGRLQNQASTTGNILYNPLSSSAFGDNSLPSNNSNNSTANLMMGSFDYPLSLGSGSNINAVHSTGNVHSSLASSIESLSSINQDLHWKLQQQRLAMLFGADNSQKDTQMSTSGGAGIINSSILNPLATTAVATTNQKFSHHVQQQQQQQHQTVPILFQNLEISKADHDHSQQVQARKEVTSSGDQTASNMEWFFGPNSYGQQAQHHHVTAAAQTPTDSGSNGNENLNPWNSNIGVQAWSTAHDLHQFSALP